MEEERVPNLIVSVEFVKIMDIKEAECWYNST